MGTTDRGIYLPTLNETGWDDEVNDNFSRLADTGANVKAFGAVGDGVADDTQAIQDAIDAALGGPMSGTVPTPIRSGANGAGVVYLPAGRYKVTAPIVVRSVWGLTFKGAGNRASILLASGTLSSVLQLQGVSHSIFEGFGIDGVGGFGSGSHEVTYGISWDWDNALSVASSSRCQFRDIWMTDLNFVHGFAIGDNSADRDVSHGTFHHVHVGGNRPIDDATPRWQSGFLVGSGVHGNILNHHFEDSLAYATKYGWKVEAVNSVSIAKTGTSNVETVLHVTGSGEISMSDIRTENSRYLVDSLGGSNYTSNISLRDVIYSNAIDYLAGDSGRFIKWKYAGNVNIENLFAVNPNGGTRLRFYTETFTNRPIYWHVRGASMMDTTSIASMLEVGGGASVPAVLDASGVIGYSSGGAIATTFKPEVVHYNTTQAASAGNIVDHAFFKGTPWVDVKTFGATGDGTTDDTTALQNALAAVAPNKTLYLSAGTYICNTSLLPAGANITMRGAGIGKTTLKKKDSSTIAPLILVADSPNFVVEDMTIDWNVQNQAGTNSVAVLVPEWSHQFGPVTFRHCAFRNFPSGVAVTGAVDVLVEGCTFYGKGGNDEGTAVSITNKSKRITVRNNVMRFVTNGVVVAGTNSSDIVIDGNDMEFGWWFLKTYLTHTNSGGTVTYASKLLTDTAANFPNFGANQRYVRAMPTLESGSTGSTYDRYLLTHAGKNFAAAGVKRGHIVKVSGKFAIVRAVGTTTLEVEGWYDATTYEEAVYPNADTAYTVYGPVLGRIESNTTTALTLHWDDWWHLDGSNASPPAAGTLYEVISRNNYPVHVVAGNPNVKCSNNTIRRAFSDNFEMQSDDCQVTGNYCYAAQDLGIALVGNRGMAVGNKVDLCGYAGIYVAGHGGVVTGNMVTDSPWIQRVNAASPGGIIVENGATGATVTGNVVEFTSQYSLQNKKYGIAVWGEGGGNTESSVVGNIVKGYTTNGIILYGTGGGTNTVTVAHNNTLPTVNGTNWTLNANGVRVGAGSPESAVTAPVGSLYLRTDGGNGTTLYVKTTGTGNTGWRAVMDAAP